ncbi:hypothetical protein J6590_098576 [Homalodisca vitripennis]|nr:hypothetical protein J6590_098576 [Homalodisca vitripennis]
MERADYMMDVIEDLSNEYLATKCVPANIVGGGDGPQSGFGLRKLPQKKEKVCKCCFGSNHPEGKVRRSRTVCVRCGAGVHAECLICFRAPSTVSGLGAVRPQMDVSAEWFSLGKNPTKPGHQYLLKVPSA